MSNVAETHPNYGIGGTDAVKELAFRLATEAPELADLAPEELTVIARAVLAGKLTEELKAKVAIAEINYAEKKRFFLEGFSSPHTRRAYTMALKELEAFARRRGRDILELRPREADAFLKEGGHAPATVRLRAAAASSFYGFLERETEGRLKNPFRGTRARPAGIRVRSLDIPNDPDVQTLIAAAGTQTVLAAAVAVMAYRGLRVGALPGLTVKGGRFWTVSKGKEQAGTLPEPAITALERARRPFRAPFGDCTAPQLADRFRYLSGRLYRQGKIEAAYSVHDLRHYFAVTEYRKTKDIYHVSKLLGHAGITVTETYLRGLGEL
jgi:integrase